MNDNMCTMFVRNLMLDGKSKDKGGKEGTVKKRNGRPKAGEKELIELNYCLVFQM